MSRERILVIVGPAQGGIKRHVENLIRFAGGGRCDLVVLGPGKLPSPAALARRLTAEAGWRGITLINAHGYRAGLVALAGRWLTRTRGRVDPPILLTMHGFPPRGPAGWLCRMAVSQADAVIAVSSALAQAAASMGARPGKVQVIPNGVDLVAFGSGVGGARGGPIDAAEGQPAEGPDKRPVVVGALARLSREKGVAVLIRAVARLASGGAPHGRGTDDAGRRAVRLDIAGDGPERGRLETLVERLGLNGVVRFLGRVDDAPAFLAGIDILAAPSLSEGQSLAAMEAMAAGRPVVASAVGGMVELVEDGRTGLLVPPGDSARLAEALSALLADPQKREAMGQAGRDAARLRLDLNRAAEKALRVMEEVAARGPRRSRVDRDRRPATGSRPWMIRLAAVVIILAVLLRPLVPETEAGAPAIPSVEAG